MMELLQVLRRVDAVMHSAVFAYVGESVNPSKIFKNNVQDGLTRTAQCRDRCQGAEVDFFYLRGVRRP